MSPKIADLPLRYQDIAEAADRIRPLVVETPLLEVHELSEAIGGRFFVKCENLQRTGSFKLRGGMNALAGLSAEERARGVVAYSSGNHAQGVALSARHLCARSAASSASTTRCSLATSSRRAPSG